MSGLWAETHQASVGCTSTWATGAALELNGSCRKATCVSLSLYLAVSPSSPRQCLLAMVNPCMSRHQAWRAAHFPIESAPLCAEEYVTDEHQLGMSELITCSWSRHAPDRVVIGAVENGGGGCCGTCGGACIGACGGGRGAGPADGGHLAWSQVGTLCCC